MLEQAKERFCFLYERDSYVSKLAIIMDVSEKLSDYQIEMVANNRIKYVLPFDAIRKDDKIKLCYNITSKIALNRFIDRNRLSGHDFIKLLSGIAKAILDCGNYLLSGKCFIMDGNFIYVNPATLDIAMVYVPVASSVDAAAKLKELAVDLVMRANHAEAGDSDDYLHRILEFAKLDFFNVQSFCGLLDEIRNMNLKAAYSSEESQKPPDKLSAAAGKKPDSLKSSREYLFKRLFGVKKAVDSRKSKIRKERILGNNHVRASAAWAGPVPGGERDFREVPAGRTAAIGCVGQNDTVFLGSPGLMKFACLKGEKDGVTEIIPIEKTEFAIGRLEGRVDYVLRNRAVGKIHALIARKDGAYFLTDMNSRNGTYLNDKRIESNKEYEIRDGDRISFANSDYVFATPEGAQLFPQEFP